MFVILSPLYFLCSQEKCTGKFYHSSNSEVCIWHNFICYHKLVCKLINWFGTFYSNRYVVSCSTTSCMCWTLSTVLLLLLLHMEPLLWMLDIYSSDLNRTDTIHSNNQGRLWSYLDQVSLHLKYHEMNVTTSSSCILIVYKSRYKYIYLIIIIIIIKGYERLCWILMIQLNTVCKF